MYGPVIQARRVYERVWEDVCGCAREIERERARESERERERARERDRERERERESKRVWEKRQFHHLHGHQVRN